MNQPDPPSESNIPATRWQRAHRFLWRWTKRAVLTLAAALLLYFIIVLVGLIPVNNDFKAADGGVEVMLISNAVHADLVLPIRTAVVDWREEFGADCFVGDVSGATHVTIGWGDAGFYIHTPTWEDLKFSTAANALLWPSQSCLHVGVTRDEYVRPLAKSVRVSPEQYAAMVRFIDSSFELDDASNRQQIPGAYGQSDAFFAAHGTYHGLNTCNSWIGRAMRSAGIRVPLLTPLPKTAFLYLPK